MKKRILSVLLIIALLVTVGIIAAQAEDTKAYMSVIEKAEALEGVFDAYTYDNTNSSIDIAKSVGIVCPVCGTAQPWYAIVAGGSINGGGTKHFWVPTDLDLGTANISQSGTAHVFLNNKTVTSEGTGDVPCTMRAGGNWVIFGEGNWTNTNPEGGSALYSNGGTIDVYGGTYTSAGSKTVLSWHANTVINLYGGTYDSVSAAKGTVNIYSGEATKVTTTADTTALTVADTAEVGEIAANGGALTVSGGTITNLSATAGTLAVSGGTITTAAPSGISMTLSGAPVISKLDLTAASLPITVQDMTADANVTVDVALDTEFTDGGDADFATYFHGTDSIIEVKANDDGALYLKAKTLNTIPEKIAYANTMSIPYGTETYTGKYYCPFCNAIPESGWEPLTADGFTLISDVVVKHYYGSAQTIDLGTNALHSEGPDVHVFLNNSAITTENSGYMVYSSNCNMKIFGNGSGESKTSGVEVFYPRKLASGNCMEIYGGTWTANNYYVADVWNCYDATCWNFVMYGGTLNGNGNYAPIRIGMGGSAKIEDGVINPAEGYATAINIADNNSHLNPTENLTINGGDINGTVLQDIYGTVDIFGGKIDAFESSCSYTGTATISGTAEIGIVTLNSANNTFTVSGGTIGTLTYTNGTSLTLSGAPTVTNLSVASGKTLTIDGLSTSTRTNLTATGAFTAAGCAAYKDCFVLADPAYKISADDTGVLSVAERTFETAEEIIDYANNHMSFPEDGSQVTNYYCPVCKGNKTWSALTTGNFNAGGTTIKHFYVADKNWDVGSSQFYMGSNSQLSHIHLNGSTITSSNADNIFRAGGQYTLMGTGNVINNGGGVALYANGGTFTIYGGTYSAPNANQPVFIYSTDSIFDMRGGTIENGKEYSFYTNGTVELKAGATVLGDVGMCGEGTVNSDIAINLDVKGQTGVTIGGTGAVTVYDSKSKETVNEATSTYGTATITNPNAVAADNFIPLTEEDGTVGYHYYEADLSSVVLRNEETKLGIFYKGKWTLDSKLKEDAEVGVVVGLGDNVPDEGFYDSYLEATEGTHKYFFHGYAGTDITNGEPKVSVLVNGIMKTTNDPDVNNERGKGANATCVNAAAYILIPGATESDYTLVVSEPVAGQNSHTIYSILKLFDNDGTKFEAKKDALNALYTKWADSMDGWDFERIGVTE